MIRRRQLLSLGGLACSLPYGRAFASPSPPSGEADLSIELIRTKSMHGFDRFLLVKPKANKDRAMPLLVVLHGLGETHDPTIGAHAWVDRYGLKSSYERLVRPPVVSIDRKNRYWTKPQLQKLNGQLTKRPFGGMAIACPFTPNVYRARSRATMLDRYSAWLAEQVIPEAKRRSNILQGSRHVGLDGCSLGGYVGLEVFLRMPEQFHTWGSVQGALGSHRIASYAERLQSALAKHGPKPIHLETSDADTFRKVNQRFSKLLERKAIAHDFTLLKGPHNQPFLRDSGTMHMLLWHDRALR